MPQTDPSDIDSCIIRPGLVDDAAGINAIYNHYICHTSFTFEVSPWDDSRRRGWIQEITAAPNHFLVVACQGERIAGFACNGRFRPKAAYDSSTEVTVYTSPGEAPGGTGSRLYSALFARVEMTPLHRAYAAIALPNPGSIRLHEKFGFHHVGTLDQVGTKFGERVDVAWYEKFL